MVSRLFLGYVVVEVAVLVVLASTIGLGRTLLLLLATFVVGVAVAGAQLKRQLTRLLTGSFTGRGATTDSALMALAGVLVVIPGLVTSVLGLLLLFPPTRAAARPLVLAIAARGTGRPLITGAARYAPSRSRGRGDYIDGQVLDVTDVTDGTDAESAALPGIPE